ncbi:MAG: Gfo/Idh/MocA family oxidoreductase, partial [Candidatus Omnitrophica bacterium]|nr:Gfo/Idh/MocA family oxidoreductase [Candidatus Omnitrophota bacterium]
MKRRDFVGSVSSIATGVTVLPRSVWSRSASNRIVTAIIGIHDRGMDLAEELAKRRDVEIRYLADPDSNLFSERQKSIEDWSGRKPRCVQDFRRVLDDPEVDAVAIATPDHWHALATIWACQAGKHVYVEKPVAHNIHEGRRMVEAARKYDRIVQVGTQNRSAEYIRIARDKVRSSEFGDIHFVRVVNSKKREPMPKLPDEPTPDGVDYDLWLGPAPNRPFNPNHFHYTWHWFWEYSGGDIVNDGIHQIDLARWLSGKRYPKTITASGGDLYFRDEHETPDTQSVLWEFDDMLMVFEQTL